jgi:hypothetical protein
VSAPPPAPLARANSLWPRLASLTASVAPRLAPLLLVVGLAPWIYLCVPHYVDYPLNGDTGIFQYVTWCIRKGERLYDTITMPDGPFVYLIHLPVQRLLGHGEEAFRKFDIALHAAVAGGMGAVLASAGRRAPAPAQPRRALEYAVWALAGACVWVSYYFMLGSDASVQRDGFYALFGSLALVLAYAAPTWTGRARDAALFFAGWLPALVTLGKHSGLVYLGLAGLSVLLGEAPAR